MSRKRKRRFGRGSAAPAQPNTLPAKGSPDQTGAAPGASGAAGSDQASPQEQDAYERVVYAGMKILYNEQTHQQIMTMLAHGKSGDPGQALALTVSLIIEQLDKKSGHTIPQVVVLPAATELLGLAAELAQKAGLFQVDANIAARAMQQTVLKLAQYFGVNPKDVQSLLHSVDPQQLQTIVQQQSKFGAPSSGPGTPSAASPASSAQPAAAPAAGA